MFDFLICIIWVVSFLENGATVAVLEVFPKHVCGFDIFTEKRPHIDVIDNANRKPARNGKTRSVFRISRPWAGRRLNDKRSAVVRSPRTYFDRRCSHGDEKGVRLVD